MIIAQRRVRAVREARGAFLARKSREQSLSPSATRRDFPTARLGETLPLFSRSLDESEDLGDVDRRTILIRSERARLAMRHPGSLTQSGRRAFPRQRRALFGKEERNDVASFQARSVRHAAKRLHSWKTAGGIRKERSSVTYRRSRILGYTCRFVRPLRTHHRACFRGSNP